MRLLIAIPLLALSLGLSADTLYERVAAKLAAQPELARALSAPPKELERAAWLAGDWNVTARVFATPKTPERVDRGTSHVERILDGTWLSFRDTYPSGTQDLGFLTFNPVTKLWMAVHLDSTGNAIRSTARDWDAGRLVFVTESAVIVGETITLRQTIEKRSDTEYRVLNEEQLASGAWAKLDEYVYVKR